MAKNIIERIKEELANAPKRKKPDLRPSVEPIEAILDTSDPKIASEEPKYNSISRDLLEPSKSESGTNISESTVSGVSYDNYHLVLSEEELDTVVKRIKLTREVSIDLETTSPNPMIAQIVGIALSPAPHEAYYIPLGHKSQNTDFPKQIES